MLSSSRRRVRFVLMLALSTSLCGALPGAAHSRPPGPGGRAVTATLSFLNAARARERVPPLRFDARLARAARQHSSDMVAHGYFAHESRDGARFSSRIAATGWMHGRRRWTVGEDLAWATGANATPQQIILAWLRSPPHRRIALSSRFRRVGIGIVRGIPVPGAGPGATYAADFGS